MQVKNIQIFSILFMLKHTFLSTNFSALEDLNEAQIFLRG